MKQTTTNNKGIMNNKEKAKQTKRQRKAEADARRRTNKRWELLRYLTVIARQLPKNSAM